MFEDFQAKRSGSRHMGASVVVALLAYGSGAAALVAASTRVVEQPAIEEAEVLVEFAPPPEEEPEPEPEEILPPEPAPQSPRPRVQRPEILQPEEIPDETPDESDRALVDAAPSGPIGGFTNGRPGGTGKKVARPTPPPKPVRKRRPSRLPENATPPRLIAGLRPAYPPAARRSGIQGVVIVRLRINADGTVARFEIVRGPEVFYESVRAWVRTIRFRPARLPDGTAIAIIRSLPIPFRLTNV